MSAFTVLASIAFGFIVGMLSGALGIGGGLVMVPVFRLLYGMSAVCCTATSLFAIIPTSISGLFGHMRRKTCMLPVGLCAGLFGALTSLVGVKLNAVAPSWLIMGTGAVVIVYSAAKILFGGKKQSPQTPRTFPATPGTMVGKRFNLSPRTVALSVAIGLVAGLLSGFLGVGGAFILVPLFVSQLGMDMKTAAGTSLSAVLCFALAGASGQLALGHVEVVVALCVAAGSVPGALFGVRFAAKAKDSVLQKLFAVVLILAAIMLVVKEIGVL